MAKILLRSPILLALAFAACSAEEIQTTEAVDFGSDDNPGSSGGPNTPTESGDGTSDDPSPLDPIEPIDEPDPVEVCTAPADAVAVPAEASVIRANRALDNFVSCLGTQTPSRASVEAWRANRSALSTTGDAETIGAPVLQALNSIAAEVCNDLVTLESAPEATPRIFSGVDFTADAITDRESVMQRIARSCWGREATASERDRLTTGLSEAFSTPPGADIEGLFLCTSMLSSLAAIEI